MNLHPLQNLQFALNVAAKALVEFGPDHKQFKRKVAELAGFDSTALKEHCAAWPDLQRVLDPDNAPPAPEPAPEPEKPAPAAPDGFVLVEVGQWEDIQARLAVLDGMLEPPASKIEEKIPEAIIPAADPLA